MKLDDCGKLFAPFQHGRLFVGFSGGADSTAALLVARRFQEIFHYRLTAIHFDHGLRGAESAAEAEAAQRFARNCAIEFRLVRLALSPGPGLESRARAARLDVWKELVRKNPGSAVILGHHAGDRAENLLLRLARGSNATGLTSMRSRSEVDNVIFLRPLLGFARTEIEEFLHENGISEWARDSSNAENRFRRNLLRNRLLPEFYAKLPGSEAGLRHSLDVLELDAEFLEQEAERRFRELDGSAAFWRKLHPALLVRVLRLWFRAELGTDLIPPPELVRRLQSELNAPKPEPRLIPVHSGISLRLQGDTLQIAAAAALPRLTWKFDQETEIGFGPFRLRMEWLETFPGPPPDCTVALFDADRLPETLTVRAREAGDALIPFGGSKPVSLKKLRTGRGIPASTPCPVVTSPDGTILWAPLIRHTIHAPVTPETRRILRLRFIHARCAGREKYEQSPFPDLKKSSSDDKFELSVLQNKSTTRNGAMKKIDFEAHYYTPEIFTALEKNGMWNPQSKVLSMGKDCPLDMGKVPYVYKGLFDFAEQRLSEMDRFGVTKQILGCSPGIEMLSGPEAVELARKSNTRIAEVIRRFPGRFLGFAVLPVRDAEAAAAELKRCIQELGFVGVMTHSNYGDCYPDEERFAPIFDCMGALDVPFYLHPNGGSIDRLSGYGWQLGSAAFGFTIETLITIARMIYNGTFDRNPNLKMILGHYGEAMAVLLDRMDARASMVPNAPTVKSRHQPSYYFKNNIWVTTSGNFAPIAFEAAKRTFGMEHILFGSDYPYETMEESMTFLDRQPMTVEERNMLFYKNAEQFFNIV